MTERVYSISEAAAKVEVESHVLRYWEEELEIDIKRNDMGHRCYSEKDVKILQRVKTLKDKGIQLKAIKDMVHRMYELLDEGESTEEKNADDAVTELIAERENTEKKTIETIRVSSDVGDDSRIVDFKMAKEAEVPKLWLTHYSPSMTRPEEFMEDVRKIFPATYAAKDGWTMELKFDEGE